MFLQNKYCRFHLFFPLSLWCSAFSAWNYYFFSYNLLYSSRTGAMCNLCCALLYIFYSKNHQKNSNKNSKDYILYTLKNKRKRTRQIWHWLAFCKVRGKLSRAKKICVLLIMQIFPPPVMFCYCFFFFWG